jgi:hypothetical protein
MADVQVTCINKISLDNTLEGIIHLGGATWKWKCCKIVQSIE